MPYKVFGGKGIRDLSLGLTVELRESSISRIYGSFCGPKDFDDFRVTVGGLNFLGQKNVVHFWLLLQQSWKGESSGSVLMKSTKRLMY